MGGLKLIKKVYSFSAVLLFLCNSLQVKNELGLFGQPLSSIEADDFLKHCGKIQHLAHNKFVLLNVFKSHLSHLYLYSYCPLLLLRQSWAYVSYGLFNLA